MSVSLVTLVLAAVTVSRALLDARLRRWALATSVVLAVVYGDPHSRLFSPHTAVSSSRLVLLLPLPLAVAAAASLDSVQRLFHTRGLSLLEVSLPVLAVAGTGGDLLVHTVGVHAVTPPSLVAPSTPLLKVLKRDRGTFRVLPLGNVLAPNLATAVGVDDLRGHNALAPAGWRGVRAAIGMFRNDMMAPADLVSGGRGLDE